MSIYDAEQPEGKFIKFTNGSTTRVRLFGDGHSWEQSFQGQLPKTRFASLCINRNREKKSNEIRILAFGWEIQKRLKALVKDEDWGDPSGYDVEIGALGEGMERKYTLVPKPAKPLTEDEQALIKACDWDLKDLCKPKDEDPKASSSGMKTHGETTPAVDEDDPFSDD